MYNRDVVPIGSMYAKYGNMDPINIPQMLAYIYHTWILWVRFHPKVPTLRRRSHEVMC